MNTTYSEIDDSQAPALRLLQKLGWHYLTPEAAEEQRDELLTNVVLDKLLKEQLARINQFEFAGKKQRFSSHSIESAARALHNVVATSLLATNEKIYDLLTLGKSFTEYVDGQEKAFTLHYIDWEHPENNSFHVCEEFTVEGMHERRRPDIVMFINGIPIVVIENKRRDKADSVDEAVSQHIRNQRKGEGIPRLYEFAQLLIAAQPNELRYAVTGTEAKFWSVWKEDNEEETAALLRKSVPGAPPERRMPTAQDRSLLSLCEPQRLLELVYKFIVFDGPVKKICRYQQYFAVQETLERVKKFEQEGFRQGGVIWHTTGSGKSLTMVMLSKALALDPEIAHPRVVIVTDRINLDKQIHKTFQNCGKQVEKASSGQELINLLSDKGNEVITTVLDKFQTAANRHDFEDPSSNIFVLVDESHRSQYGTANQTMRKTLPNACYIGFTGTPLLKREKNTARKFGGFIHKYTIEQAVQDGAVLPLLYEGRAAKLEVNRKGIDKGFDRLSEPLNENARKDLKKKFSSISKLYESDRVVEEVAHDISVHYTTHWQNSGLKAQLAVPRIDTAVKYQKYFEGQTDPKLKINTAVVFTPPDSRQDYEDVWKEASKEARKYWGAIMERFHNQEAYEKWAIDHFKDASREVEIIIVVSKLLTGFDAPRNTILYLAKPLHSHNLLQAIARVNRLFAGKEHGYIVDYVGLLGKLDEALTSYSAFDEYEEADLQQALQDVGEEIEKVPGAHAAVWDVFKEVKDKSDNESLERHLSPQDRRDQFYEALSHFLKVLQTALSTDEFYERYTADQISFYRKELSFFEKLKRSVQRRYNDVVSYKEYEPRVQKLIDRYVDAEEVESITDAVNIMNKNQVAEALAQYGKTPASRADYISSKMKKVIHENMDKDEAFYKKFSRLIEETIEAFYQNRIDEKQYLEKIMALRDDMESGYQEGIPASIRQEPKVRAFYGGIAEVIANHFGEEKATEITHELAQVSKDLDGIVSKLVIRDWKRNKDVQHEMENEIEDYLMARSKDLGIHLNFEQIDDILARCMKTARNNY